MRLETGCKEVLLIREGGRPGCAWRPPAGKGLVRIGHSKLRQGIMWMVHEATGSAVERVLVTGHCKHEFV